VIGVVASEFEYPEVREFFELFKTPWEFYNAGREYDVVLCSGRQWVKVSAKLVLIYHGQSDTNRSGPQKAQCALRSYRGDRIPIYGGVSKIEASGDTLLIIEGTGACAASESFATGQRLIRIGYDLFHEIRHLLTKGQPGSEAMSPTLELHIALLRDLIIRFGIPLVEIPPVPAGYKFIACLTHDVDHPAIWNHVFDHTMFGFLYRATVGSIIDFIRGRKTFRQVVLNVIAALSLPLVYAGWVKDPWNKFDRYVEIEKGVSSTFFVIPRRGDPGVSAGKAPAPMRAANYEVGEIAAELHKLKVAGWEIGVHGLDAWHNAEAGRGELEKIKTLTRSEELGVRMHWLYSNEKSATVLEEAGFSYDSTCGYNETIGYRAGTLQAFKPLSASGLMELPMHVMDTALFFRGYSNYSAKRAESVVHELVEHAVRFGGALTFNWHDRSIAPERLWDQTYINLLRELRSRGAWMTNAGEVVAWFRKRRDATVSDTSLEDARGAAECNKQDGKAGPALRFCIHENSGCSTDARQSEMEKETCAS
jgi:hypothetical protein